MNKIYLFKDQKDYIIKITNDDVINIIGTKGSGKTTTSLKYIDDDNYIVVNCDRLLELPSQEKKDNSLLLIKDMLIMKYGKLEENKFNNYYNDIVNYILNKKKKALIEGNALEDIEPSLLKGTAIIKRTAVFKSFVRAIKRDYKNDYFMKLEKEKHKYCYKLTRFYKITKRRSKVFKQAKDIEKKINKL